ncbi:hypothetical protein RBAM_38540 [Bacillus velezensis FZB42]|uniref:Uncharacterized protein n=1 Tax=Bacillus velezensis (strain DSM 23117 / BGSC 10A6 / LMG 26770 / FZB42) TaxID=326423 RepID=A0A4Y6AAT6_BACVZ|nr:hypothetical protein B7941_10335 [Bacillus velezensis]OXS83536.1 hypothetical protein B1726_10515 [Bacillus sp. LYLB4]QDE58062.1 hypothetical protein RBAM_38540 [Bacillus velezensis FZB42]TNU53397.1 hypothetical protein FH503_01665 [Bacillus velezensis]TNU70034.1 hypothetical protein FH504_01610 [Bacillus velezensis]
MKARDGRNHADQPFSFLSEPRVGKDVPSRYDVREEKTDDPFFLKGWYREISFLVPYGMRGLFFIF